MSTNTGPPLNLTKHDRGENYDIPSTYTFSSDVFNIDSSIKTQKNTIDSNKTSLESLVNTIFPTNLLYNGGFSIWTRGTSFTDSSAGFTADLWYKSSSAEVLRVSTSGFSNAVSKYALALKSSEVGNTASVANRFDNGRLINRTFTIACYASSNLPNTTRIGVEELVQTSTSLGFTYSQYHSGSSSPERLLVTLTVTNGSFLKIYLLHENPTETLSYSYFWDVTVVEGLFSSPDFIPRPYIEDLVYCRRFYKKIPIVYVDGPLLANKKRTSSTIRALGYMDRFQNNPTVASVNTTALSGPPASYSIIDNSINDYSVTYEVSHTSDVVDHQSNTKFIDVVFESSE